MGVFIYRQQAEERLPAGEVNVRMEFAADAARPATGGEVTLYINDKPVGKGRMDHTVPIRFSAYAGMGIGRDNGGVVDLSYEDRKPFAFTGTIKKSYSTSSRTCQPRTRTCCTRSHSTGTPGTVCRPERRAQREEGSRWHSMTKRSMC